MICCLSPHFILIQIYHKKNSWWTSKHFLRYWKHEKNRTSFCISVFTFDYLQDISITSIFRKSPFTLFINTKGHLIILPRFWVKQAKKAKETPCCMWLRLNHYWHFKYFQTCHRLIYADIFQFIWHIPICHDNIYSCRCILNYLRNTVLEIVSTLKIQYQAIQKMRQS